jgi:hypothetical protein
LAVRKRVVRPRGKPRAQRLCVHRILRLRFVTIGRSAPHVEAGCVQNKHIFPKRRNEIFFAKGLDKWALLRIYVIDLPVGQTMAARFVQPSDACGILP